MLAALALAALALALLFAGMAAVNLALFRSPPRPHAHRRPGVSLLIPARDEEANIGPALDAACASDGVDVEIIVLDDGSTDATAATVAERARRDPRIRLIDGRPLPSGWNGKQFACWRLAHAARFDRLVFVDADVRLGPGALAAMAGALECLSLDLASAFPREVTRSPAEALIVPMVHVLLLGYLPLALARARPASPALAAGCGQLMAVRRDAYFRADGHRAIRASGHDGITLPRAFRRAGLTTDFFDAGRLATCRMYAGARRVWAGFSKNATEGMATPAGLPVWTVLLGGGHVAPVVLAPVALAAGAHGAAVVALVAAVTGWAARGAIALRFRQSALGAVLHPAGVALVLVLQWQALIAARRGGAVVWRRRAYKS